MQTIADKYLSQITKSNSIQHTLRQSLTALSLVVTLCVFWGLKLTGITMAGEAFCGIPEHVHSEDCPTRSLICTLEETEAHIHSEACILRELICEAEEIPAHTHTDACLSMTLVCALPEQEGHTHTDACIRKTLSCTEEETPGHTHGQECREKTLVCELAEEAPHVHSSACYSQVVSCGQGETTAHSHDDSCISTSLTCSLPETEGHTHSEECWVETLVCTLAEEPGHTHSDDCYTIEPGYSCGMEEQLPHSHTDECYIAEEGVYCCGLEETEGHTHSDACYHMGTGFGCGLTEAEGHIHSAECVTEQTQFGCGKEATPGHSHGDDCYDTLEACPLEEHIHTESCYSDITADLETSDDWEMSLAGLTRSSSTAENIILVASSQLGSAESLLNFQVDEAGVRRGITRYGQWYGNPYGDWSAMFVSFCLSYAGVEEVPANAGPEAMRLEWEAEGLYRSRDEFSPTPGHVLFLDGDGSGTCDAVAIITGFQDNQISAIQGDVTFTPDEGEPVDVVAETSYDAQDPAIMGYGLVPFAPELMLLPARAVTVIAQATAYDPNMFTDTSSFVLYTASGGNYYAFDGSGNAVPVSIGDDGSITADVEDPNQLLWTFTADSGASSYFIQNVSTGRYMHAHSSGVTTTGRYSSTLLTAGNGVQVRSNTEYAQLNAGAGTFQMTQQQYNAAVYQFGIVQTCTVWLDGTNGGLMGLGGSPDRSYSVKSGDIMQLPDQWPSPEKYSYTLRGWYDVINNKYYAPGAEITVTDNMVFYADWVASSYDVGQYNSMVSDTVSTNDFITTRMFDYGVLFNVLSEYADVTVSRSGHSEVWNLLTSGPNPYNGEETLGFVFRDWDRGNEDISYPRYHNDINNPGGVYAGLYNQKLRNLLFDPGTQVIGKQYLGTGDHLFQLMEDTSDPHYGYYYYDSERNAASYNQSAGRFYVYDYLECTRDSAASTGEGKLSDFLPLNSPYANTNGNTVSTYAYAGVNGEYSGVTHYMYDAKYNTNNNSADYVGTNYWFGMSIDINFYLPNAPGTQDGNKDLYGKDMHFQFSGDDDVWVLIDGQLALDMGGIHGIESGDINFSTGDVTVNGTVTGNIRNLAAGDHKLTILYLERGSSLSNCAIYFNLAPRFSFSIQKEDTVTQDVLNGAEFSVYLDRECTVPAQLWENKASHDRGDPSTHVFTVRNGVANMWGMGAGNTYYIVETKPPDAAEYSYSNGIIRVTIDKQGLASYDVEIIRETDENGNPMDISNGFTVHGFRIDEETQRAYIIATNSPEWVMETTSVTVRKQWNDDLSHAGQRITVYLTVTDPDGTVRRIREVQLGSENNWTYCWDNLPKYWEDGTQIQYGTDESYTSGYYSKIQQVSEFTTTTVSWVDTSQLRNGETYILKTSSGCLSTLSTAEDTGFKWVSEAEAKASPLALWTVTTSGSTIRLTNGVGQTVSFYYANGSPTDFFAFTQTPSQNVTQQLSYTASGNTVRFYYDAPNYRDYYISGMNSVSKFTYSTSSGSALVFTPAVKMETTETEFVSGWAYQITNTPLDKETSLTVQKQWNYGFSQEASIHQQAQVTVKLLANGSDTGRTVTLSLKNNWVDTFRGLPYTDSSGTVIHYSVQESWQTNDWIPYYGEIITTDGDPPTYSTTITNVYRWGTGEQLPSTGSAARLAYMLCGGSIMLSSLVYGFGLRNKRKRRQV